MKRINWIILRSKDRGSEYGVGTFIKQFSRGLVAKHYIDIYLLEIGTSTKKSFSIQKKNGIILFEVPLKENSTGSDTKSNQEKIARNIARVVSQYIPKQRKTVVHMNYLFQYFIAAALKETMGGKIIFTQHVFVIDKPHQSDFYDLENTTYNNVDQIITVTNHGKSHLIEKGIDETKIKSIYNGIDPNVFALSRDNNVLEKYGLDTKEKLILYSGRIDQIKGLDYLCTAMENLIKKFPNCRLVIAGDGNFESLIAASGKFSSKISFLGFIPFEDIISLYHKADVGVIPSLEEHCSYVALEMLHCGLPVVASKLGGLKEIFLHEENALLADTKPDQTNIYGISPKEEQLEELMYRLLNNENLRKKFSENSKRRAVNTFTTQIMINNYLQTAKKLLR